jgi:hypothetical protein
MDDHTLQRLYTRYCAAVSAARSPAADLAAVDAMLEMRVALYEYLVRTGWEPPAVVRRQLERDALLLEQPPSLIPA